MMLPLHNLFRLFQIHTDKEHLHSVSAASLQNQLDIREVRQVSHQIVTPI